MLKNIKNQNWGQWVKAAAVRAIKTFAQVFGGFLSVGAAVQEIQWGYALSVAAVAAVYSVLMSLAGLPEVDPPIITGGEE